MTTIFNTNTIKLFKLQDLYLNQPINIKTLENTKAAYLEYTEKIFLLNPESKEL